MGFEADGIASVHVCNDGLLDLRFNNSTLRDDERSFYDGYEKLLTYSGKLVSSTLVVVLVRYLDIQDRLVR